MRIHDYGSVTDHRISAAVRALLSGRGMPPKEAALLIDIPKGTMYSKLNGTSPWKASEVEALARLFDVRLTDLYDGLGGRVGPPPEGPLAQSVELRTFNPLSGNGDIAKVIPFRPRFTPQDLSFAMSS